jgi:ABC-type transport system substrate-binding protein
MPSWPRSPAGLGRPSAGRPRHYFVTPLLATDELAFNTRHGPFTNPRLRRAVNYAVDRRALAAALGDLRAGNYLPPGMPAPASGMSTRSLAPISRTGRAILAVCSNASCAELGRSSKQTSSASDYTYSYGPTPEPSHPRRADQAREISSMRVMTPSGELRGWSSTLAVTT